MPTEAGLPVNATTIMFYIDECVYWIRLTWKHQKHVISAWPVTLQPQFESSLYFNKSLQLGLLNEGGHYSRAATIQRNMVTEVGFTLSLVSH